MNKDFFEIRLESIGGLGANLSGKLLGEAAAIGEGLNASAFSSYGSEKRGSPVKSYIRISDKNSPIRINSPVVLPDILCVFYDKLTEPEEVFSGVREDAVVIINSHLKKEEIIKRFPIPTCRLCVIDALEIALELKTRINMVLIGAICKLSEKISIKSMENTVKNTIGKKYPKSLESNISGIKKGFENAFAEYHKGNVFIEYKTVQRKWGYENAPIGGINYFLGSTVTNNLSSAREGKIPVFNKEKCINCGLCETTCPDYVYQFEMGEYKGKKTMINLGIDYAHCKGCMRCVEICPTNAITEENEFEVDLKNKNIKINGILREDFNIDYVGANSWVESESYTTNSTD